MTMHPAVSQLALPEECRLCHGGCYEYGCAGTEHPGTPLEEIACDYPDLRPVGFSDEGTWDYRGESPKEEEPECKARAERIVQWLLAVAEEQSANTVVLVSHQTMADLLCRAMVEGSTDSWAYGEIRYRLQNAGITELFVQTDGRAVFGARNDGLHLRNDGVHLMDLRV